MGLLLNAKGRTSFYNTVLRNEEITMRYVVVY